MLDPVVSAIEVPCGPQLAFEVFVGGMGDYAERRDWPGETTDDLAAFVAQFVEDDPALLAQVTDPDYDAVIERVLVFHVETWDVNCPQHIRPRSVSTEGGA